MDPLSARHDFLTAHEKVKGVGEERIVGVWSGVKWPYGAGEFVHREEVCSVFFED